MTTISERLNATKVLSKHQLEQFIEQGYCLVRQAFAREEAAEALDRLWEEAETEAGVDPNNPSTWSRRHLHIRKGLVDPPFRKIAHAPRLRDAFDDVLGEGRWHPLNGLGWWPITFPGFDPKPWQEPQDGWHVDGIQFHHHVNSPDQGLLPIPIFSDIEPSCGGTVISLGSHKLTTRILQQSEPDGLSGGELSQAVRLHPREKVVEVQGNIGDVALLHPFMLHANSANCGVAPRIICNPCVRLREPMKLKRANPDDYSAVERAIVNALNLA